MGHLWIVEVTHIYIFAFKFTGKFVAGIVDAESTTLVKLVAKFATGVVDTGGKFATGVVDTGGNFAAGVGVPVANLPPVSLIPVVNLELRISPRIFEKI